MKRILQSFSSNYEWNVFLPFIIHFPVLLERGRIVILLERAHINNIYKSEELDRKATCAKIAQVQIEGKRKVTRSIPYFNLDMIISVGYRVNSKRGIQFRIWANKGTSLRALETEESFFTEAQASQRSHNSLVCAAD